MFMQNAWYAAAWRSELKELPLGRRICGQPVVLYRTGDGSAAALEDLCCHRLLPLSHGRIEGDLLVCGYHGLTFNRSGQCVRIPSQAKPGARVRVRSYPIVERHRLVWIWIGDPALADPAQVPDLRWNDAPGWAFAGDMLPMACDYRLVIDNLLDLTHETYIHPTTLGHDLIPGTPIETNWDAESVTVSRLIPDHRPAPFWAKMIERAHGWSGRCDRWQIVKFVPPCNVVLDVGVAEVGTGAFEGNRSRGITGRQLNSLTPATATTCWYFWSLARDFALDDEALTRELQTTVRHIFAEDQTIIEAQQRSMLENPGARTININLDAASIRMRQMIEARSANGRTQAA